MKSIVYIIASVFLLTSCYSSRSLSSSMEDDIYYVPGAKPLIVKEVETETGQHIDMTKSAGTTSYTQPESDWTGSTASVINRRKGTVEQVNTADLAYQQNHNCHLRMISTKRSMKIPVTGSVALKAVSRICVRQPGL